MHGRSRGTIITIIGKGNWSHVADYVQASQCGLRSWYEDTSVLVSFSLCPHPSVSSSLLSLSLSSLTLSYAALLLNPVTPLIHPTPAPLLWFSAGCFHGNITFNCLRWALTFQFCWFGGWKWVSCCCFFLGFFVMWLLRCAFTSRPEETLSNSNVLSV